MHVCERVKPISTRIAQVCRSLKFNGTTVPKEYEPQFQRALWTFQHQRVFCPDRKALVHLRELPEGGLQYPFSQPAGGVSGPEEDLDFLGPAMPDEVAHQIAIGARLSLTALLLLSGC